MNEQWYKWPYKKGNSLIPWYQILRRIAIYPLLLAVCILVVGLAWFGWGMEAARKVWDDMDVI